MQRLFRASFINEIDRWLGVDVPSLENVNRIFVDEVHRSHKLELTTMNFSTSRYFIDCSIFTAQSLLFEPPGDKEARPIESVLQLERLES